MWCWGRETVCADDGVLRVRQIRGSAWRLCWVGLRFACSRRTRRSELELGARWGCWSRFRATYSRVLGVDVSLGIFGLLERNLRRYGGISETEDSCKQAPTSKPCAPAAIYTAFELRGSRPEARKEMADHFKNMALKSALLFAFAWLSLFPFISTSSSSCPCAAPSCALKPLNPTPPLFKPKPPRPPLLAPG